MSRRPEKKGRRLKAEYEKERGMEDKKKEKLGRGEGSEVKPGKVISFSSYFIFFLSVCFLSGVNLLL